jgi:hypothetical protein
MPISTPIPKIAPPRIKYPENTKVYEFLEFYDIGINYGLWESVVFCIIGQKNSDAIKLVLSHNNVNLKSAKDFVEFVRDNMEHRRMPLEILTHISTIISRLDYIPDFDFTSKIEQFPVDQLPQEVIAQMQASNNKSKQIQINSMALSCGWVKNNSIYTGIVVRLNV